eukprot:PITA_14846
MQEEYSSIMKNDVWEVVPRPEGKSVVTSRWLYKERDGWKNPPDGCEDCISHGSLQEEVYIEQPQGFEVHGKESHVCRLKKALYGLKQAPRAWYSGIDTYLQGMGFTKSEADPNLYYIVISEEPLILDDLIITGAERLIEHCKRELTAEFEMKDIGLMHYFLGLEVWQGEGHFFLVQEKYIVDILGRFHMKDCKPMSTPMITKWKKFHASDSELVDPTLYRQLIGSLMYLVNTRPYICFIVNTMSLFMCEPRKVHWVATKHILRYLQGTVDYGMDYKQGDGERFAGYTDYDCAGCASDRKSTSGCCFGLGLAVVSWFSRKQQLVALSSAEAEYMAASLASCEAIWLRKMLFGLFGQPLRPLVIYCDN